MPPTAESIEKRLAAFEQACRAAGLRLTHQRLEIYRQLALSRNHPTAEALYLELRKKIPTVSLDTVYRTLTTFASHGLINKVETIESQAHFEVTHEQHHHLICSRCKEIIDFEWRTVDDADLPEAVASWGRIDTRSVVVSGICRKCLP
ncbi:Fur family transcriptional regulator [Geobacter sp. SVR]|uniref:Fur family transcriptional regulator n=1 Tax=Geobacter sp. SVR TaxID=2495594 RepID=UPI00143F04A0|nr:Fur family transcriptional regulator [Geobacter sp. SVR]BCS55744.1 transcriptional repressor [Geobacter sp. SVR]GCF83748.1 transcriptional repressor [Geobacter sp. SVR]